MKPRFSIASIASVTPITPITRIAMVARAFALLVAGSSLSCGSPPPEPPKTSAASAPSASSAPATSPPPPPNEPSASTEPAPPDVPSGAAAARDAVLLGDASRIVDAFINVDPAPSPDGKKIVFRSNRDGLSQLYIADAGKPKAPAVRLTKTTERTSDAAFTPDGKTVLFLSDHGADENFSIFRVGVDGGEPTELTAGEKLQRDAPLIPDGAPDTLIYSARRHEEPGTRIYVQSLKGGAPKLVYTDKLPGGLLAVDNGGRRALVQLYRSGSDVALALVDLALGRGKTIYPPEGKTANVSAADFSGDQKTIFVATDDGTDGGFVLALDGATNAERARYSDPTSKTAMVEEMAAARQGDRLAIRLDAGNRSMVRLLDQKTLKPAAEVKLPLGTGASLKAARDGKSFAIHWSTPNHPPDIQRIDARSGAVQTAPDETRPTLAGLGELDVSIQTVPSFDGTQIPVNVYKPKSVAAGPSSKKYPVLVSVHGGPAGSSAVRWSPTSRFFTAHGFIVVEPNVRGSTGFGRSYEQADDGPKRMDAVKDLEQVGKWVLSNSWADPSRLVVFGGSYGGYMTLMGVTNHPTLWKAGVDLFGIYDWRSFMRSTSGLIYSIFQKEIGPQSDQAFLLSISPANKVEAISVPLFVYAGANDPRVARSESDAIVRSLRARKVPVEYMLAENEGHSLDRKENLTSFLARSQRFLEDALKLDKQ